MPNNEDVDNFENELANRHSGGKFHVQWPAIPNLELQWAAGKGGVIFLVSESGMNGRSRDMDANPQPRKAAFSFDPRRKPRLVRQLNSLDCPSQQDVCERKT
jgi:hypothetical protein